MKLIKKKLIKWYLKHEIDSIKLIILKSIRWNNFSIPKTTSGTACGQKKPNSNIANLSDN